MRDYNHDDDSDRYYETKSEFMSDKRHEWVAEGNCEDDFNEDDFLDEFHDALEEPPSMQSLGMTWREFL